MTTIGFIGLGNMGRPMASNLCRKGFHVVVHDVVPGPVQALVGLGATRATSIGDLANRSEVVFTMLPRASDWK